VNVNPAHHGSITEAFQQVRDKIDALFNGYEREFYFKGLHDFQETMDLFVGDHHIDMIITMPKDHSWLGTLLGNNKTKKMMYHSSVPVFAIHQ